MKFKFGQVVVGGHVITSLELRHACGHIGKWVGTCDNAFLDTLRSQECVKCEHASRSVDADTAEASAELPPATEAFA